MLAEAIAAGRRQGKPVGICGQAPSDYPELAAWLVEQGISSISLNPDVVVAATLRLAATEAARRDHRVCEAGKFVPDRLACTVL